MTERTAKNKIAWYLTIVWMVFNAVFFALEVTVLNDAADLNNSISLVLAVVSIVGLLSMRKMGAALTVFTLTYMFSFNVFNVIYYPQVIVLNGASAIINAVAIIFMFRSIFRNKYR